MFLLDTTGKTLPYDRHVILNVRKEHYAMRKAVEVMIVSIFAKKLNRRSTKVLRTKAGKLGYIVDLVYRMYFHQFYHFNHKTCLQHITSIGSISNGFSHVTMLYPQKNCKYFFVFVVANCVS